MAIKPEYAEGPKALENFEAGMRTNFQSGEVCNAGEEEGYTLLRLCVNRRIVC
jgi:hypothetical protein